MKLIYRIGKWANDKSFAYYRQHNTYTGLPRYLEAIVAFVNGYGRAGHNRLWHGLKALPGNWVLRGKK